MAVEGFGKPLQEYEEMLTGKVQNLDKKEDRSIFTYRQTLMLIHAKASSNAASKAGKGKPFSYRDLALSMDFSPDFGEKLKKKWENLRDKYKKIVDPATGTGNPEGTSRINWVFFEPMWACLREDTAVHPEGLLDSGNPEGPHTSFAAPKMTTIIYSDSSSSSSSSSSSKGDWKTQAAAEIAAKFLSSHNKKSNESGSESMLSSTEDSALTGEASSPSTSKIVPTPPKVAAKKGEKSEKDSVPKKKYRSMLVHEHEGSGEDEIANKILSAVEKSQTSIDSIATTYRDAAENTKSFMAALTSFLIAATPKQPQAESKAQPENEGNQKE